MRFKFIEKYLEVVNEGGWNWIASKLLTENIYTPFEPLIFTQQFELVVGKNGDN